MMRTSLDRKTVAELKKMLNARGISDLSGRKADLIARLDDHDSDDKIVSPAKSPSKPAVVSTPVKKGGGLGWLLNLVIAISIGLSCVYFGGNIVKSSLQDDIDQLNFFKMQALEDEGIIENMGNEKLELLGKLKEVRRQYDSLEQLYNKLKAKSKKASKKEGFEFEHDFESKEDTQKAKESSDWDDEDDGVYCYIDNVFNMNFFTKAGECNQHQKEAPKCPFTSVETAVNALKMHPRFIALQQSDRGSKERKKIIKELSIAFHPDKLKQMGCDMEFGQEAMVLLNDFR